MKGFIMLTLFICLFIILEIRRRDLGRAFRENYEWSFKVSKYNKNKAVLNVIANHVHKTWLNAFWS